MFDGIPAGRPDEGGFVAGFAARHAAPAALLEQAFLAPPMGFAPADLLDRIRAAAATATADAPAQPRHFSPADRAHNPTAGWDPLDPDPAQGDPLAAAHAAGFAEGRAAAEAEAEATHARDRALLDGLAAALAGGGRIDRERVAARIRDTVMLLVGKLVGEAGVSPELLAQRVATATELLADTAESALLRVNPADVDLLEGRLPATVFAVGDAAVERGSFVMESASTVVEDGPTLWLEQLTAAIDAVPLPAAC